LDRFSARGEFWLTFDLKEIRTGFVIRVLKSGLVCVPTKLAVDMYELQQKSIPAAGAA